MIRTVFILIVLILLVCTQAIAEETGDWTSAPVFTKAYEASEGVVYFEWMGNAPYYQVYIDGKETDVVSVPNTLLKVENGAHTVRVFPINEADEADENEGGGIKFGFDLPIEVGLNFDVDVDALGLEKKDLVAGNPSEDLSFDYRADTIFSSTPGELAAETDEYDRVVLSFVDRNNTDEYIVTIKNGKDIGYVTFDINDEKYAPLVENEGTRVKLLLDPQHLQEQGCLLPELDVEQKFAVQVRKYSLDLLSGSVMETVVHESKQSDELKYTPMSVWKNAPEIVSANQTADGQLELVWAHVGESMGCEYNIMLVEKALGVKTGESIIAATSALQYTLSDLEDGKYCFSIAPTKNGQQGIHSKEMDIEIKNEWSNAPSIEIKSKGNKTVSLAWATHESIVSYHISVYAGDNASLLRFVDMDYSLCAEIDIENNTPQILFEYNYDEEIDPEKGVKLKFEVYGVRYAADGHEQRTSVAEDEITLSA